MARFVIRTGTPVADLVGRDRAQSISRRRQELMWLLRQLTTASMSQIGELLGGRTAATVDEGVDRVSMRALNEPPYRTALADLREAIAAPGRATVAGQPDLHVVMAINLLADLALADADARMAALTVLRSGSHGA